jgi:Kinesin motor domain
MQLKFSLSNQQKSTHTSKQAEDAILTSLSYGDARVRCISLRVVRCLMHSLLQCDCCRHPPQVAVYNSVGKTIKSDLLAGNAVVMFAYGLSGSGKTFTTFVSPKTPLLITTTCHQVCDRCQYFSRNEFLSYGSKYCTCEAFKCPAQCYTPCMY